MNEDGPPYLKPKEVAAELGWHPNTIRNHIVPLADWTEDSDGIPAKRFGRGWHIPRWWVKRTKEAGLRPPETPPSH